MIRDASSKPPPSLSKSTEPISKAVNAGSAAFGATPAAKGYSNVRAVKYCWTGAVRRYARRSSPASTFSDEPRIVAAVITNKDPYIVVTKAVIQRLMCIWVSGYFLIIVVMVNQAH